LIVGFRIALVVQDAGVVDGFGVIEVVYAERLLNLERKVFLLAQQILFGGSKHPG